MKSRFNYEALGERIRKSRKAKRMTQEQLAEACDLSTAHIGHIERGTRALSIESLIVISEVLGVSIDYLLLDASVTNENKLAALLEATKRTNPDAYGKAYTVIKILLDNIDKLH